MADTQHRETPLADKSNNLTPDASVLVKPGFGVDTATPGGLYIGQNNATSVIVNATATFHGSVGIDSPTNNGGLVDTSSGNIAGFFENRTTPDNGQQAPGGSLGPGAIWYIRRQGTNGDRRVFDATNAGGTILVGDWNTGDANLALMSANHYEQKINAPDGTDFLWSNRISGADHNLFRLDATSGHLFSLAASSPSTSALGANVTSVTPTGNDVRGKLVVVMGGSLAANTRICTVTFGTSYGASAPVVLLVNHTAGAGLAIVNFYKSAVSTGVSFDLAADQGLVTGTYEAEYFVMG